ncbi:MAG: HD domain-containing protein [Treponema sp.]|nr:HD domain-containing protein [Treponema sp.]
MKKTIEASLNEDYTHPVRDVLWGHIYMTEEQAMLTESVPFMRLNRILQLGPVYLVYPGATHTRASHSIGVYHLGRRLLQNLAQRGASSWLTHEGVKSFLAACLLHDLGHFPYTHSLKELSLSSHEKLSGIIILNEPIKSLVNTSGADPTLTAAIVDKEIPSFDEELLFYRKLLSGALDPDKLDYLNRDARYCGVPYGAQDVDFIFSRLNPDKKRGADIDSRLIPNVESVLFSKYLMYRTVYWHRNVRAVTAMVKKALMYGLESGKLSIEDMYNLDDYSLFSLLEQRIGGSLVESVQKGQIYTTAMEISVESAVCETACGEQNNNKTGKTDINPLKIDIDAIRNVKNRAQFEENLAQELRETGESGLSGIRGDDIIIDIPEPISFETGLYVTDEQCNFSESSSAFKIETVNAFIKTLYTARIYINQKFKETLKTFFQSYSILNKENWRI